MACTASSSEVPCGPQVVELPREDPAKALRCFASVPNLQVTCQGGLCAFWQHAKAER